MPRLAPTDSRDKLELSQDNKAIDPWQTRSSSPGSTRHEVTVTYEEWPPEKMGGMICATTLHIL
jgi:hypothetical protein